MPTREHVVRQYAERLMHSIPNARELEKAFNQIPNEHKRDVAAYIVFKAFEHGNENAYELLEAVTWHHLNVFKFFIPPLVFYAFEKENIWAYQFLQKVIAYRHSSIVKQIIPYLANYAFERGNESAYQIITSIAKGRTDAFEHFTPLLRYYAKKICEDAFEQGMLSAYRFLDAVVVYHSDLIKLFAPYVATYAFQKGNNNAYKFLERHYNIYKEIAPYIGPYARNIVRHAFEQANPYAYFILTSLARHHPDLFHKYFSHHIKQYSSNIIFHTFVDGNKRAYRFLHILAQYHPDLFLRHFSTHIASHAFEYNNEKAYNLLTIIAERHPDLFTKYFPQHIQHYAKNIASHAFEYNNDAAYRFLHILAQYHPDLFHKYFSHYIKQHIKDIATLAIQHADKKAIEFLNTLAKYHPQFLEPIVPYLQDIALQHGYEGYDGLSLTSADRAYSVLRTLAKHHSSILVPFLKSVPTYKIKRPKRYISLLYYLKHLNEPLVSSLIHKAMEKIYKDTFKQEPPKPSHPPELPTKIEHEAFMNEVSKHGTGAQIPEEIKEALRKLGFHTVSILNIYNIIDILKHHREEHLNKLLQNANGNMREQRRRELSETIDRVLPELESITAKIGTKRIITNFHLEAVPKDALKYVEARIKASDDCTVPGSEYPGFEEHTVPTFFSSNAGVYKIVATHLDTARNRKRRFRIRKNRHVGNVYFAVYDRDNKKVLYIHGVQLGNIYRGKENVGIAKGLIKGLVDTARKSGIHEIWISTRDLSNYGALAEELKKAFRSLGARPVDPQEIESLHYRDLPKNHYASPHRVRNHLLKLEIRK